MVINGTQAYDKIWDWVYETLHFHPSGLDQGHDFPYGPPFRIPFPYAVYGIERMEESQQDRMEELVRQALLNVTVNGCMGWIGSIRAFSLIPAARMPIKANGSPTNGIPAADITPFFRCSTRTGITVSSSQSLWNLAA